jgi:DHA2 family multidrug resistance protein
MSDWKPRYNPWLIAITVTLATFMEVLDTSIANVALPHIAGNLSAGTDESTWVLTSYLVANAIILPLSGWFSSIFGRKRYYMISVAIFTASSFLSGLAPSLAWLVVFRILQGLGGGGLQPCEQAILADTFEPKKRGMAMALYGFAVVTAPIIGPTLGGWITDNFSWRWIFFINIPVGFLSIFLTSRIVEDPPHLRRRHGAAVWNADFIGLGFAALAIGSLQYVLDKGQREDWFGSHLIVTFSIIAVTAMVFGIVWEWTHPDPTVDIHLLRDRNFFVCNTLIFALGFVLYGSTVLLPLFVQTMMGYTATLAGLMMSPGGFLTMMTMPLVGFLLMRFQPRWLIVFGLCVVGASLFYMSGFDLNIDFKTATLSRVIQAGGLGFLFVPINTAAFLFIPKEKYTNGSGLFNLSRNIGGSVGIAVATTMLSRKAQIHQTFLASHMTSLNANFAQTVQQMSHAFIQRGINPALASTMAQARLYGAMARQAEMLAYVDTWRFMGFVLFAVIPLVFLLKTRSVPPGEIPVH